MHRNTPVLHLWVTRQTPQDTWLLSWVTGRIVVFPERVTSLVTHSRPTRPMSGDRMPESGLSSVAVRFDIFEVDLRAGELRRKGQLVKLQNSPSVFCLYCWSDPAKW